MSDILIHGMELPKCGRITIQIGADGAVYLVTEGKIIAEMYMECNPAITVKPHGRLIDADALGKFPYNMDFCDGYEADEWVQNAPTVIPASE